MTEPSREQLFEEGFKQARIYGVDPKCAEVYAEGWAAAARRIVELERQLRCVQAHGLAYLIQHGKDQIAIDPRDVTIVLPTDTPATVPGLLADIAQLQKHIRRANDMAKRSGDYAMAVSEYRDEAWKERDQLRERIRKVRELCGEVTIWDSSPQLLSEQILAALDGEGEELAAGDVIAYVVRDRDTGMETGYPPDAVRIVYKEPPRANGGILPGGVIYQVGQYGCVIEAPEEKP